jgi:hypothetical protein
MSKSFKILFPVLLLFSSCEKRSVEPYTIKYYGDAYEDTGYSVSILNDGYVIAGQITDIERSDNNYISSSNRNMGIIKTGWDGNVIWKISAGGKFDDWGSKICQLSDGSLICAGTFTDTTTATPVNTDIFIVKVSSTGNIEWQYKYGGQGNQTGNDIIKTSDGFMILGTTDAERAPLSDSTGNRAGNTDIYLVKIADNGDLIESFAYGYPGNDLGTVIKYDQGNNYIVLGTTDRSEPDQDKNNLIIVRINDAGHAIESKIIGGTDDEYAGDIEVLSDGYLISGTIGKEGETQKIFLTRLMNNIYGSPAPGFPKKISVNGLSTSVKATSTYLTGSFVIAGQLGTGNTSDMLLFEIDSDGNMVEGHQLIKGSTGMQIAYDVVAGDDGYIVAVGCNSYDVNSMISFLKFKF